MKRRRPSSARPGGTDVRLTLGLEGAGAGERSTGMASSTICSTCSRARADGPGGERQRDLQTGAHHTAEEHRDRVRPGAPTPPSLPCRDRPLRLGHVPMDEARASAAIDISGRPFTLFEAELPPGSTGGFEHELTEEFFRALANAAKLTLHLRVEAGTNAHHMIEAAFKAFARALREAVAIDRPRPGCPARRER